ncbi:TOB3 (member of AAA-ATPase family) [Fusarium tjaetaba]|uniref:TOB3 (Member of AAA-ATPase family) n=1 Tax=Fusarium tjaetaba TaxID=1567544 RepID=A0A8H5VN99_9HYPO|nr:TOB3 (member of AAA-ATPase family) [Fusarium tjaetaba]KAF5629626.1 TOB3 (member of AAA-ATPase family) [Fusarium tjaetaba]
MNRHTHRLALSTALLLISASNTGATDESPSPPSPSLGSPSQIGNQRSRQNIAVPYLNDHSDDSDFGLEYDYQRRAHHHGNTKRDLVIDLIKLRRHEDSNTDHPPADPAIIWNAMVYQSQAKLRGNDIDSHGPDLTYVDDRPIEFSIGLSTQLAAETDEKVSQAEAWTGPVIIIETLVEADIDQDRLSRMKRLPETVTSSCLDLLNPKHVSPRHLVVAFDMVWYPLKPGIDVYVQLDGSTHAAVVMAVRRTDVSWSEIWGTWGDGSWQVDLWRLETDGSRLYRNFISGPIKETAQYYTGKVVIDHGRGRAESEFNRGLSQQVRDYSDLFRGYDGILLNNDRSFYTAQNSRDRRQNHQLRPPSINNARINGEGSPESASNLPRHDSPDVICMGANPTVVQQLTEHQLLLLCPDVLAYGLRRKHWMLISLDYVQEPIPSEESISNLIIAQDELKTIQALSNCQNSQTRHWSADFIEGKGSGQIILLQGPPGVGKTYTVEAISEWLRRPLLALTVADIGTVETLVEGELMKWFDLAEAWNAVLLVDEADIFLERRQNRDLARNGLVSAFLRRMEYFKGLLFLTTNRVGQIVDAFVSRVHIAIGYQALDEETRRKVWSGFFRKLVRERAGKVQIAPDAKKWVLDTASETNLNGRDIRNALQTAITLAEFESEEDPDYDASLVTVVTKAHFQKVLEMCNRFRSYVTSIRREDEMKRAQGRGDRNDYGDEFDSRMC